MSQTLAATTIAAPILEESGGTNAKGIGNLLEHPNGRIAGAALDAADIGSIEAGLEAEFLLRPAAFAPDPPYVQSNLLAHVHRGKRPRQWTIGLRTMSHDGTIV